MRKKLLPIIAILFAVTCSACRVIDFFVPPAPPTPTLSPPPTPTRKPTSTPRPTPTPVTSPIKSALAGDVAFFYGDWETALSEYQQTFETSPNSQEKSAALLGLGKTYYQLQKYPEALNNLRMLLTSYSDSAIAAEAQFALARTYTALNRHLEAASAYEAYLSYNSGVIDAYVQEQRGDAYTAAGKHLIAIEAYQAAIAADSLQDDVDLRLKMGRAYFALEDYATAVVLYEEAYAKTNNDYLKASADYLLGQAFTALERPSQAQAAYQDAVENYPLSYDAYLSLIELIEAGHQVSELDRGLVDYFAGQYGLASEAFDRYISQVRTGDITEGDPATAYYYKGFALRAQGDAESALWAWDRVIDGYPEHTYWDNAWEYKAYTQWAYLDRYSHAVQTLTGFVDKSPYHARAAEFLFDAARVEELTKDYDAAISLWDRLISEYPTSDYANQSLFLIGITHYRVGAYQQALEIFTRYVAAAQTSEELAQAYFWLGKTHHAAGEDLSAQSAWNNAVNIDITGYYSERARDLLQGREAFIAPLDYDLSYDAETKRQEAEDWMRSTFVIPPATNLSGLGMLAEDARLIRGAEFWNLGLYDEARLEFEDLRNEVSYDPISSYRLANYLSELGLYRSAIFAARQVLNAANMDDAATMNAPLYFNYIRFGSYYRDLIIPTAQKYNFSPLFLFSVVRQESLFEGFVHSSAGARGLMQIMPGTGEDLARKAGWPPNYTADDLYRPKVSVNLGTAYLDSQRRYFDGDIYTALAAYNAGAGNALIWAEVSNDDPDLFLETVRFSETRRYIKGIKEIFAIYRRLYGREQ
ncbi:MAG: hypothetical protein DRI56_10600 [Chloroflexota bacterium]|nr:MAG: hypothetical protein DRI56_10600 [Chloroflexota bacterium]